MDIKFLVSKNSFALSMKTIFMMSINIYAVIHVFKLVTEFPLEDKCSKLDLDTPIVTYLLQSHRSIDNLVSLNQYFKTIHL